MIIIVIIIITIVIIIKSDVHIVETLFTKLQNILSNLESV